MIRPSLEHSSIKVCGAHCNHLSLNLEADLKKTRVADFGIP